MPILNNRSGRPGLLQRGENNIWRSGEVKLNSGDTLRGQITYDLNYNVVKHRAPQGLRVYPALQVVKFNFSDDSYATPRTFYSLPFHAQPNYRRLMFFEQLAEGKVSLFARARKVRVDAWLDDRVGLSPIDEPGLALPYAPKITVGKLYAADGWGNFYDLVSNTEEVLLSLMQDQLGVIKEYIRANDLNLKQRDDVITLVKHYNALSDASRSWDPDLPTITIDNKIRPW